LFFYRPNVIFAPLGLEKFENLILGDVCQGHVARPFTVGGHLEAELGGAGSRFAVVFASLTHVSEGLIIKVFVFIGGGIYKIETKLDQCDGIY